MKLEAIAYTDQTEAYVGSKWNTNGLSIPSPYNAKKEITIKDFFSAEYYPDGVPLPNGMPGPSGNSSHGGGFLPVPRMRVPIIL